MELALGVAGALTVGGVFASTRYKISAPDQFIIKTGLGIKTMKATKKGFQWPFQKIAFINMSPRSYHFDLHNMSREKVEFKLPVVFTIAPRNPFENPDEFMRYAQMMSTLPEDEITETIRGIVEGETRSLTAQMTIEDMFQDKDAFRIKAVEKIQQDLSKLGLHILNANIKEMADYDENNKYFSYRKQRAIETANYESQVEVAEAKKRGEIDLKERERDIRTTVAQMDTEAIIAENERKQEICRSNAKLEITKNESKRRTLIANIEADFESTKRFIELKRAVELRRQEKMLEKLRADQLQTIKVEAEQKIAEAGGIATTTKLNADAILYRRQKKAESTKALLLAHAAGIKSIVMSCEGDQSLSQFYLSLDKGLYEKLAKEHTKTIQGMSPKINIWNTGDNVSAIDCLQPLVESVNSVSPLLDSVKQDLNISPFKSSKQISGNHDSNAADETRAKGI